MTPAQTLTLAHLADIADLIAARDGTEEPDVWRDAATALRRMVHSGHWLASPLHNRDYFTMKEAADIARVSPRHLRRLDPPSTRIGNRRIVPAADLAAWLRDRTDRPHV